MTSILARAFPTRRRNGQGLGPSRGSPRTHGEPRCKRQCSSARAGPARWRWEARDVSRRQRRVQLQGPATADSHQREDRGLHRPARHNLPAAAINAARAQRSFLGRSGNLFDGNGRDTLLAVAVSGCCAKRPGSATDAALRRRRGLRQRMLFAVAAVMTTSNARTSRWRLNMRLRFTRARSTRSGRDLTGFVGGMKSGQTARRPAVEWDAPVTRPAFRGLGSLSVAKLQRLDHQTKTHAVSAGTH